jgi:hypothetical protein
MLCRTPCGPHCQPPWVPLRIPRARPVDTARLPLYRVAAGRRLGCPWWDAEGHLQDAAALGGSCQTAKAFSRAASDFTSPTAPPRLPADSRLQRSAVAGSGWARQGPVRPAETGLAERLSVNRILLLSNLIQLIMWRFPWPTAVRPGIGVAFLALAACGVATRDAATRNCTDGRPGQCPGSRWQPGAGRAAVGDRGGHPGASGRAVASGTGRVQATKGASRRPMGRRVAAVQRSQTTCTSLVQAWWSGRGPRGESCCPAGPSPAGRSRGRGILLSSRTTGGPREPGHDALLSLVTIALRPT